MAAITTKSNGTALFPVELEKNLFSKVKGHSSLAKLSASEAIPFCGKDIFTFNFSNDVSIVAESGNKPAGDAVVAPVHIVPLKIVYQERITDEFVLAAEEKQLEYISAFTDGFAKKLGSGLDKMAMHGIDPKSKAISAAIGTNCFDKISGITSVTYNASTADTNINDAVAAVEANEYAVNGIAISTTMRQALANLKGDGRVPAYPEFNFGACPETLGSMKLDANATVSIKSTDASEANTGVDHAIVGDFENCFRWGIAEEIPMKVIEYGNPDGQGDLQAMNQIILRAEAYIGWAILDANAFARVKVADTEAE